MVQNESILEKGDVRAPINKDKEYLRGANASEQMIHRKLEEMSVLICRKGKKANVEGLVPLDEYSAIKTNFFRLRNVGRLLQKQFTVGSQILQLDSAAHSYDRN